MNRKSSIAAYYYFLLFKKERKLSQSILEKLDRTELNILVKKIKKINLKSKDIQQYFFDNIQRIIKSNRYRQKISKNELDTKKKDSVNFVYYVFLISFLMIIILFFFQFHNVFEEKLFNSDQRIWLSFLSFLILFPFALSYALKYKYFSKMEFTLEKIFLSLVSGFLLIGILGILNYMDQGNYELKSFTQRYLIWAIVFGVIIGPGFEEVLFRGLIFEQVIAFFMKKDIDRDRKIFEKNMDTIPVTALIWSFVISSFAFAIIHKWGNAYNIFFYFLCGLILAYGRYKSRKLWVPWLSHSLANAAILFI